MDSVDVLYRSCWCWFAGLGTVCSQERESARAREREREREREERVRERETIPKCTGLTYLNYVGTRYTYVQAAGEVKVARGWMLASRNGSAHGPECWLSAHFVQAEQLRLSCTSAPVMPVMPVMDVL